MTTISGISSSLLSVFQLNQTSGVKQPSGAGGQCETGEVQGNRPPGPPPGGGLADAIMQALSDIGATGQSSTDSSSSSTDTSSSSDSSTASTASTDSQSIAQAFGAFMHNLIGALHSQSESGTAANGSQDSSSGDVAQVQGGNHHRGGPGNIQADLQSLIQKLSSSSSDSSSSDSTSSTQSSLQQSFSSLLSTLGANNGDATLNKFLQALQNDLPGVTSSGNIVNTTA